MCQVQGLSHLFPKCCRRDAEEAAMRLPAGGAGGDPHGPVALPELS